MPFSYYLLQVPSMLLLFILVVFFSTLSIAATWLFKKYVKFTAGRSHNEFVGYIFGSVGGLYGLLLGFVVFLVWDAFNGAQTNANREGSLAKGLYRDIKYYPDTVKTGPLMKAYMNYVHHVIDHEFKHMEQMQPFSKEDRREFNLVYKTMEAMDAGDPRVAQMFHHLNELATYRALRQLDASSETPVTIWVPLILGALIVLLLASLIDLENMGLHLMVNALLGGFIGMIFYIIIILDHPLTGQIKIEPDEYNNILTMAREDE